MFVDEVLKYLREDKNSVEKLIELFEYLKLLPEVSKKQDQIIELLKAERVGMSPDFRALLLRDIDRLNSVGEDNNSKGKEENKQ